MAQDNKTDHDRSVLTRRQFAALGIGAAGGTAAALWGSRDAETGTPIRTATEDRATPKNAGTSTGSKRSSEQQSPEPTTHADAAGVPIVAPGDLPRALANAAPHTLVRCAETVFEPSETLVVPPQVELDARGATIQPQHDEAAVQFFISATMRGGVIDLGGRKATALQVHAGKYGRFDSPVGPRGVTVRAEPGSGAIGFRMAIDSGEAMIAHQPAWIRCEGVSRPLVMRAKGPNQSNNFMTSNDIYVKATDFETGISMIGENTLRKNRIVCDLVPDSTGNGTGILIDNPTAKQNWFEGVIREPDRLDHVMVIEQCDQPGENVYGSWLGHSFDSPPKFVDRSEASDNRIVDFGGRSTSRDRLVHSPFLRNPSTVPLVRAPTPSTPTDDTIDPNGRSVVAEPGGLQAALDEAATTDGPNVVRARNGATFEPNDVHVPAGVTFDARPASFRATRGNHRLFSFASDSRMLGGHVQTSEGYSGSCFAIVADDEVIENATGPLGATIDGENTGETALLVKATNGGVVRQLRTYVSAENIDYGLDVVAEGGSKVTNNTFRVKATHVRVGVRMRGDGVIATNNGLVQIQPKKGLSKTGWFITNPRARNNWTQGWFWDGQHFESQHVVTIRNGSGNVYPNFLGQDASTSPRFFRFADSTDNEGNYPIAMADIGDGRRSEIPFPVDRLIAPSFDFGLFGGYQQQTV